MSSQKAVGGAFLLSALMLAFNACSGSDSTGGTTPGPHVAAVGKRARAARQGRNDLGSAASVIKHVIIVIMENRTVDNLFQGFPGADTQSYGYTHTGAKISLIPVTFENPCDLDHSHGASLTAYANGNMNGFDLNTPGCTGPAPSPTDGTLNYGYVPQEERQPYVDIASQFAFADRMFSSQMGPSYAGHVYPVAGTSNNQTDDPGDPIWGCDAISGTTTTLVGAGGKDIGSVFPCMDDLTLADLLDRKGLSWKYYTENIDYTGTGEKHSVDTIGLAAFRHIRYGPDWNKDISEQDDQIFTDIAAGNLPTVSWLNPPVIASDHPGGIPDGQVNLGPMYNATLVNTIAESQYWDNTVILLTWDDWGGWYDHVKPEQLDDLGLGFRVPLLVISKYAKHGYISETQHEYGSMLHFCEDVFNLGSLGATDVRADDLADMFDFANPAATFTPIVDARLSRKSMERKIKTLKPVPGEKADPY